jgi:glycosyltransferase involved in cell wall biosynthesis
MSNIKKNLLVLTPGFPKDEADSTCMPAEQSFLLAVKENYPSWNIIVLSFQYPYHQQEYNWFEIRVIPFGGRNKGGLSRLLLRRKIYAVLKKIHQAEGIDGMLSFWCGECAWIGKHFGDRNKIKHYCWLLGQDAKKNNHYPGKLRFRREELIALSDFLQDEFEKNHHVRPAHLAPPFIDIKAFPAFAEAKDIDILGAGSLVPLKQYSIFIDAITALKKQFPVLKVVLIGDGPEKERLQNQLLGSGLGSTVSLSGQLPHTEVLRYMQRSKLLLHPSSYEGFGIVCAEALYAGAHVISFTKPLHRDIKNWHIVRDKEEMINQAVQLLKDPVLDHRPVIIEETRNTAARIMRLFL